MSLLTRIVQRLAPGVILPYAATGELLHGLVYSDIYGGAESPEVVTRATAMRVAPIKKGRAVIVGRLGDLTFEQGEFINGRFVADANQPAWLTTTTDIATTPWYRFAMSLDDVVFTGWSMWAVERDEAGAITDADRIERDAWRFDPESPTGVALKRGLGWVPLPSGDEDKVILFAGPDEGLLSSAHDAIVGWRHMERAWVGRVRNPIPLIILQEKEPGRIRQAEAQGYVDAIGKGRTSPNGTVAFLPGTIEAKALGEAKADLFNEGRNAARIDFANFLNLPVTYLDGSTATSSLTYVTQEGDRNQVIDDLEYWIAPFDARLSEPDVTGNPRKVIRLNRSNLTNTPNDPSGPERTAPAPQPEEA